VDASLCDVSTPDVVEPDPVLELHYRDNEFQDDFSFGLNQIEVEDGAHAEDCDCESCVIFDDVYVGREANIDTECVVDTVASNGNSVDECQCFAYTGYINPCLVHVHDLCDRRVVDIEHTLDCCEDVDCVVNEITVDGGFIFLQDDETIAGVTNVPRADGNFTSSGYSSEDDEFNWPEPPPPPLVCKLGYIDSPHFVIECARVGCLDKSIELMNECLLIQRRVLNLNQLLNSKLILMLCVKSRLSSTNHHHLSPKSLFRNPNHLPMSYVLV
jgi:hypothetical protein